MFLPVFQLFSFEFLSFAYYLFSSNLSTSIHRSYMLNSSVSDCKSFLTCLRYFISTIFDIDSQNSADVPLSNKQKTNIFYIQAYISSYMSSAVGGQVDAEYQCIAAYNIH